MPKFNNHYWIDYSSEKGDYTIIESTSVTHEDANSWALNKEKEDNETNIQVWKFEPITGVCAAVLNIVNG